MATASDFVIFNEDIKNERDIPYVWTGRRGFSRNPFAAHVYKDRMAAERAIKRNTRLQREGIFYLTADEFGAEYGVTIR